jgi:hypothetical protein
MDDRTDVHALGAVVVAVDGGAGDGDASGKGVGAGAALRDELQDDVALEAIRLRAGRGDHGGEVGVRLVEE